MQMALNARPQFENTWIPNLLKFIENKNIRVFILGSTKEVNKIAIKKIKNIHPKIKIEGHHGYFDKEGDLQDIEFREFYDWDELLEKIDDDSERSQIIDLLKKMLEINPLTRISAEDLLRHSWLNDTESNETVI